MKVCTKKIRPLARSTNHHYQRYLFSLYEKKLENNTLSYVYLCTLNINRAWKCLKGGTTVDIMKIDHCEGCEWEQFQDWFDDWKEMNLTVRILLLGVHSQEVTSSSNTRLFCQNVLLGSWVISFLSQRSQYSQYTIFLVRIYFAKTTNQDTFP